MTLQLADLFDLGLLDEMLREGFVRRQAHPTLQLAILNYAPKAMYDRVWNPVTRQCRGLIYREDSGEVVARPFAKFFNLGELADHEVPTGLFAVLDKLDGSLGILYEKAPGSWAVATRGSFTSEQAVHATKRLHDYVAGDWTPIPGATYLWEIVYPGNRIVLDYGAQDDLVLLEVLRTDDHERLEDPAWPGPRVQCFPDLSTIDDVLGAMERPNREGYVLRFDSGERVKVKQEEYVRLHRILTGVSAKTIWEYLSAGMPLDPLLSMVPDEFYDWVQRTVEELEQAYTRIAWGCQMIYPEFVKLGNEDTRNPRRGFARAVANHGYKAVLFKMLDGKPYADLIWKSIKPTAEKPFREDEP